MIGKLVEAGYTIFMIVLIVRDHYPDVEALSFIPVPMTLPFLLFLLVVFLLVSLGMKSEPDSQKTIQRQALITGFLILLVVVFTFIGSNPEPSLSAKSIEFWAVVLIFCFTTLKRWRDLNREINRVA